MAENDPLTGIKNKKAIEKEMLSMVQRAVESHEQITFGFVDIDDFRDYNTITVIRRAMLSSSS